MTSLVCDVCGKKILRLQRGDTPGKGVSYVTFQDKDICSECADQLDGNVRQLTRDRDPFVFAEVNEIKRQVVTQMCEGKK